MIVDLVDAGGELTVDDPDGYWGVLVGSAKRYKKVPAGKVLTIDSGSSWKQRVIRLKALPDGVPPMLEPITVDEKLTKPHPVVKAIRTDWDHLRMQTVTRARLIRILDAIAKAAAVRGYEVARPDRYEQGVLKITIRGQANAITVEELDGFVRPGSAPVAYVARERLVFPGRLRLKILRGRAIHTSSFADARGTLLDARLPELLRELEVRAAVMAEDERAQRAREREREREREEERAKAKIRWEAVRAEAVIAAREHHRASVLRGQVEAWHQAQAVERYLAAMVSRIDSLRDDEKAAAEEWLAWALEHVAGTNPLLDRLSIPPDPELSGEALCPFMKGLSPHSPDRLW